MASAAGAGGGAVRRLVLLGEPGAGKSTALRELALLLALRLTGQSVAIPG